MATVNLTKRITAAESYGLGAPVYGSNRADLHARAGRLFGRNGYRVRDVDTTPGGALDTYALTLPRVELYDGPRLERDGYGLVHVTAALIEA